MSETIYRVDHNHSRLRLTVLISIALGFFGGAFAAPPLVRAISGLENTSLLVPLIGGAVVATAVAWIVERILKQVWPSGREIHLGESDLILQEPKAADVELDQAKGIAVKSWSFAITNRRAWVRKGWYCIALRAQEGESSITAYTFMSPEHAADLPGWPGSFTQLLSREELEDAPDVYESQAHFRSAEEERWWIGAEMLPADFEGLVGWLAERVPYWPPGA
jgi:hypothetical protein